MLRGILEEELHQTQVHKKKEKVIKKSEQKQSRQNKRDLDRDLREEDSGVVIQSRYSKTLTFIICLRVLVVIRLNQMAN